MLIIIGIIRVPHRGMPTIAFCLNRVQSYDIFPILPNIYGCIL